jgi:hypothetical protein
LSLSTIFHPLTFTRTAHRKVSCRQAPPLPCQRLGVSDESVRDPISIRHFLGSTTMTVTVLKLSDADAYLKVLALANERTDTADTDLPAATVYAILGVKPALTPAAATILGNVLDDKKTQDVDTIDNLNRIAASAQRIAEQAANATTAHAPTVEDFRNLGINGVTDDNVAAVRNSLYDVPTILRGANRPDRVIGPVDTLREVKSIVAHNIGQLQVLINYAEGRSPINPASPLQTEPVEENYRPPSSLGLISAVTASNLPSINSALRAVGAANMNSWKKVGEIVASYEGNSNFTRRRGGRDIRHNGLGYGVDILMIDF